MQEVETFLREIGLGLDTWSTADNVLHQACDRNAYDAHVPSGQTSPVPQSARLRHPLSGDAISGEQMPADWPALLSLLRAQRAPRVQGAKAHYLELWRQLMNPAGSLAWLGQIPGDSRFTDHTVMAHRSVAAALVGARLHGDEAALLHLHIGPVQGFIAAARRTHDLWLGSYIVAYLAMQAVYAVADALGPDAVLYPDLSTLPLYHARTGLTANNRLDSLQDWLRASIPNRFMAIVPAGQAKDIAQTAATAVFETWEQISGRVRDCLKRVIRGTDYDKPAHWNVFDAQIGDHLEMDARIRPWGQSGEYHERFKDIRDDLTAQRRLLTKLSTPGTRVPKCTQCGEREQIAQHDEREAPKFWITLRSKLDQELSGRSDPTSDDHETLDLRDGEALCAICLTKRFANRWYFGAKDIEPFKLDKGDDRLYLRFPSVASIASAPFRKLLRDQLHSLDATRLESWRYSLASIHKLLGFTPPGNLLPALDGPSRAGDLLLNVDGTWFYESSYEAKTVIADHDNAKSATEQEKLAEDLKEPLQAARSALLGVRKQLGDAHGSAHVSPYYAIISLDVDRMGKWLDGSHEDSPRIRDFVPDHSSPDPDPRRPVQPSLHREISRRQGRLATEAVYKIVETEHLGRVIYSGGDDVLAFLPLSTLWRCLADLRAAFRAEGALGPKITLSAGVAITHWRNPLGSAIALARQAEKTAKETRDRLVLSVDTRSGRTLRLNAAWDLIARIDEVLPRVSGPASDPRSAPDDGLSVLYLNNLERLEQELPALASSPAEALDMRLFTLLTGGYNRHNSQLISRSDDPVLRHLRELGPAAAGVTLPLTSEQYEQRAESRLQFLYLLRFLARERGPSLPALSPFQGETR